MATFPTTNSPDDAFARPPAARGALVGGAAALVASAAMLWAGRGWGGAILAQLLSDRITAILPLDIFRLGLDALESDAKPLTLAGLTVAQALLGAAGGAAYARVARADARGRALGAAGLAATVWLALNLIAAPLGAVGLFARHVAGGLGATQATFVLAALLYGALTAIGVPGPAAAPSPASAAAGDPGRRRLVTAGALALPALASGLYVARYVQRLRGKNARVGTTLTAADVAAATPPGGAGAGAVTAGASDGSFTFAGMPPAVTPTDQFYIVSKNFVDPSVDTAGWSLEVSGLVATPLNLSYSDLTTRPASEFTATLECISNSVGGKYMSTGVWQGFPLAQLLQEAGLRDGVVDIELHAADGYVESIPLAKALDPRVMLVHTINGQPLPDEHGKPARLIVPNIYGMKNVKWLTRVVAVNNDVQGYWQRRGWSDIATEQTMSRIDAPKNAAKVPLGQPMQIGGVAFAGSRGISSVELSLDGGQTWNAARLSEQLAPLAWRLWAVDYTPTRTGDVALIVRATDGQGTPQDKRERGTLPDGATGYHTSFMKVV